jgi:glycosyltransferase involved in cell wall biosynthesis
MTRILMVIRAGEGGAFRHVADLSGALVRQGYEVAVCGPHRSADLAVPVLPLEMSRAIVLGSDARASLGFARIVRDFEPDIVHAHGNKAGVVARVAHIAKPGTPVIYSPHGYAFAGHFSSREQKLYRTLESFVAPLATMVVCVCEAEARLARATGINSRIRVVHNGIEPIDAAGGQAGGDGLGPRICATSGLRPGKGLDTLIEAMVEVVREVPDARLALAGGGPERAYLEAVATCNGVGEAVEWLGNLEADEVIPLLSWSNVFVNPSWSESFPYSVLEAMAVGAPIVATDVGGVAEAIEDQVTGVLVPPQDRVALADALIGMLEASEHAAELGARARERQRAAFTLERMVAGAIAVYDEVLSAP